MNDKVIEIKQILELRDDFSKTRHGEKKDLINLRQTFAVELVTLRDTIASKRHGERIQLIEIKFSKC